MKHEVKKIAKITAEDITFCLLHKSNRAKVDVVCKNNGYEITIEAYNIDITNGDEVLAISGRD